MNFNEYQKKSKRTAIYPKVAGLGWVYPAMGLASEAGEVANKLKKVLRDNGGEVTPEVTNDIKGELGDVLWYVAQISSELNLDLEEIAHSNLDKLLDRKKRNVIKGSGDNR